MCVKDIYLSINLFSKGFKVDPNNKESKDFQFVKWMARNKVKKKILINILKLSFVNENFRFVDVFINNNPRN